MAGRNRAPTDTTPPSPSALATPQTLADLTSAPYNPRTINAKALDGLGYSMAEFGDLSGIVLNRRTGHLVAGHQRVKSLRARYGDIAIDPATHTIRTPEGHTFAVRLVDWPVRQEKAANVAANAPTIQGQWTQDLDALLADIAADMPEASAALDLATLGAMADADLNALATSVDEMADWGRPPEGDEPVCLDDEPKQKPIQVCRCPRCGFDFPVKA